MTSDAFSPTLDGHSALGHLMEVTCGSVGSATVYLFTVIPEPADVLPERKFVSLTSASSSVRGLNGRRIPHDLQTSSMPS
jgi:hypothetical protein